MEQIRCLSAALQANTSKLNILQVLATAETAAVWAKGAKTSQLS